MLARNSGFYRGLQKRFREKRARAFVSLVEAALAQKDSIEILDAGGVVGYWRLLPEEMRPRVKVTILNYDAPIGKDKDAGVDGLEHELVVGDACNMPQYADNQFDIVHSNSVVEHVGGYDRMGDFAREIRRVGRSYYVQTPNYWFPIDPHNAMPFLHWLPDPFRAWLSTKMDLGLHEKCDLRTAYRRLDICRMVSRRLFKELFPDGEHSNERFMLIFTKSLMVRRTA